MSPRQKALWLDVLPRVALPRDADGLQRPAQLFTPPASKVWLEIGFGGGEHLVWQATHNSDVGLIGCEPFEDGVVKVLSAIDTERLANIRVHADDGGRSCVCCPTQASIALLSCFPTPGPRSGITSAGWFQAKRSPSLPASCVPAVNCASPRTSARMHAQFC